jgi:hypothetical protein
MSRRASLFAILLDEEALADHAGDKLSNRKPLVKVAPLE